MKYIVVGNVLKDMESDHAIRVARLANEMISTLKKFNDGLNPTGKKIDIKIGIHTGPMLTGIFRMKSFVFDVWGELVPIAEQLSITAPNNTVVISIGTHALISSQFATQPLSDSRFAITLEQPQKLQTASTDPQSQTDKMMELYGVYPGTGDAVDRDYVIAQGFVPVDEEIIHDGQPVVNVPIEISVDPTNNNWFHSSLKLKAENQEIKRKWKVRNHNNHQRRSTIRLT